MASTVIKAGSNIVRLSNEVNVAEDGFVTLRAAFYVPTEKIGEARNDFALYQPLKIYPKDDSLPNLPTLQDRLTVSSSSSRIDKGLCYYDVTFVSAVSPAKIAVSESVQRLSFNGFYDDPVEGSGSLSFDYYTKSVTHRTTIIRNKQIELKPKGEIVFAGLNTIRSGLSASVEYVPVETVSAQQEIVGNVARVEVTSTVIYSDTTDVSVIWTNLPLPNGGLSNPWETEANGSPPPPR
jgi:hypothetical protein